MSPPSPSVTRLCIPGQLIFFRGSGFPGKRTARSYLETVSTTGKAF